MGAKPPILEFLRIVCRTSDFGVLNIINNIFKTLQNLRFWSFCGGRKTSDFGVLNISLLIIFLKLRKTSDFGGFAVGAKPPILEFLRIVHRTSDF